MREHLCSNPDAFACLVAKFAALPEAVQTWLIPLSEVDQVAEWAPHLEAAAPLRAAAARLLQAGAGVSAEIGRRWLQHADWSVRLTAVALGAADHDLPAWLAPEQPMPVRVAALRRLARQRQAGNVLLYLDAPEWELRAAATEMIVRHCCAQTLAGLRQLALRPDSSAGRTAAVQALLQLGEADWLEENLLAPLFGQPSGQENLRD